MLLTTNTKLYDKCANSNCQQAAALARLGRFKRFIKSVDHKRYQSSFFNSAFSLLTYIPYLVFWCFAVLYSQLRTVSIV